MHSKQLHIFLGSKWQWWAAYKSAEETFTKKTDVLHKSRYKVLDASSYDTIYKAQNYINLLDDQKQAAEEYVEGMFLLADAHTHLYEVAKRNHSDDEEALMQLNKIAKETRKKFKIHFKEMNESFKENKTMINNAEEFIRGINKALDKIVKTRACWWSSSFPNLSWIKNNRFFDRWKTSLFLLVVKDKGACTLG